MIGHNATSAIAEATPVAHKGAVVDAKAIAMTVLDLMTTPQLLVDAKAYFDNDQQKYDHHDPFLTASDVPAIHKALREVKTRAITNTGSGMKKAILFSALLFAGLTALPLRAADTDALTKNGVLDRLIQNTGVYNKSKTGKAPGFVSDPSWPKNLPHSWLLGQVGGLYADSHDRHLVYNRPRTLTDEAGLENAVPGAKNAAGVPIDGIGHPRPYGPLEDCCKAAPSVLEFDAAGNLLQAWGGPSDPAARRPLQGIRRLHLAHLSTAFMSTRMTMSGWAATAARPAASAAAVRQKRLRPGPPTGSAVPTALSKNST